MNHFLALRLTDETRDRLAQIAGRLQAWDLSALWVSPQDYHLTVAFLGELDADEAHLLPSAIDLVAGGLRQPTLHFSGIGAWGGRHEPRVVFAALSDTETRCRDIHLDLCDAVAIAPERDFSPHITLCRPQRGAHQAAHGRTWPDLFTAFGLADWGRCNVTDLVFCRRRAEPGPRYEELAAWPLVTV
jgi:RNA 2',3'-cyclic 3'-phosphodiesterase